MTAIWMTLLLQDPKDIEQAGQKALELIKDPSRRSWALFLEEPLCGLAYMASGTTVTAGPYSAELRRSIECGMRETSSGEPELANWNRALKLVLLTEVYKKAPSPELKTRIEELIQALGKVQESTGGWQRRQGYSYPALGGVPDISILSAIVVLGMGNAKGSGLQVPQEPLDRVFEYFRKISDGGGLSYGTNNGHGDACASRCAAALIGMHMMNRRDAMYDQFAKGLRDRHKHVFKGHDSPYLHYLLTAVGCRLIGAFDDWKSTHMRKILDAREPDGSIWFENAEKDPYERRTLKVNTASTAVLAILCNLHKGHIFQPPAARDKPGGSPKPRGKSPFSQR
jgi:hypothetical protein